MLRDIGNLVPAAAAEGGGKPQNEIARPITRFVHRSYSIVMAYVKLHLSKAYTTVFDFRRFGSQLLANAQPPLEKNNCKARLKVSVFEIVPLLFFLF